MIMTTVNKRKGFSLVEVLIFVSVFSIALVALVGSVSYSSLLLNDARYKLLATRYSEELAEWLKFQREFNKYLFIEGKSSSDPGTKYCFNSSEISWPDSGSCSQFSLAGFFKREVLLVDQIGQIKVTITTSYRFLNGTKPVVIEMSFNEYDL